MKYLTYIATQLLFLLLSVQCIHAQGKELEELWKKQTDSSVNKFWNPRYLQVSESEALKILNKQPSFAMYKDNYFITGIPTNEETSKYNADIKFQLSIRQRLLKRILPFNTLLMLTYTQKSFWNIYQYSSPFEDNNYNPGLVLAKPIISKNRFLGLGIIAFEHESNGRSDSLNSRSWNYFVFTSTYFYNLYFSIQAKFWIGWYASENKDLSDYKAYGLLAFNYRNSNDRLWITLILNPHKQFHGVNTQLEFNFRLRPMSNQYIFLQWYNGYAESLLEYNKYTSMIRFGIVIKPPLRNLY